MKRFVKFISVMCAVSLLSGCGLISESDKSIEKKKSENSVVTVNGESVSKDIFNYYFYDAQDEILKSEGITNASDISDDFWDKEKDGKTLLETAKENALSSVVEHQLQYQKAVEEGIELTADENASVQAQVSQMKQNQNMISQLEQMGIGIDSYEELYKQSAYIQKLVTKYVDEGVIKLSDEEVTDGFLNDYVKAKHILFATVDQKTMASLSTDEISKKEEEAKAVLKRIRAGEDFDALMKEYSEDPGLSSAPDGYVFTFGEMVSEFEDAAFSLKEGEVSDLVKSAYGYHIIKREPLDMKESQEEQSLESYKYSLAIPELEKLAKEWKKKADIKINDKVYKKIEPTIVNNK